MRKLEHVTEIEAPAATVWQVLTATEQYNQWNPFMPSLIGALHVGERLTLTIRTGQPTMRFRPILETPRRVPFSAGGDGWASRACSTASTS